ncbi:polyketide cyclase [Zafaria cholistanensis]|uniref:Polyketide cyclase n=1 Tax=Zafaria cholistanensis TaxID=1682741 RepID=A0A5A7NU78_9MICC|nr:ATPase [Zafaria cholistanensis]GER24196.1 polyketide cyclase [Zafaria cholistanensis]
MSASTDRIERSILIRTDLAAAWALVSEPGWFINDGGITRHEVEHDGDLARVTDPDHGTFLIRTVALEEPHRAAFRWLPVGPIPEPRASGGLPLEPASETAHAAVPEAGQAGDEGSTLIEFQLEDCGDGTVRLTVSESGFESLPVPEETRRHTREDNTEGWIIELAVARQFLERGPVPEAPAWSLLAED